MGMVSLVVKVMDFIKPVELFRDEIHQGRIYDVLFTPDGKKLVSSSEERQIYPIGIDENGNAC